MICQFFDDQDRANPWNGTEVTDAATLHRILADVKDREPFICLLYGKNGYDLTFGVGPFVGFAQYARHGGEPPFLMAVDKDIQDSVGYMNDVEFLCGNTPTPIPLRECLPMDRIIDVVVYFQETGERSPHVGWEDIYDDPSTIMSLVLRDILK
jgi:hypothetical protein